MTAPRLTRALVLEAPVRVPDGAGGYAAGWQALGTLWAEVEAAAGGRAEAEGLAPLRARHRITVRAAAAGAPSRPQAGQRFREGGRVFAITAVTERDAGGRFLTCLAEEAVR